MLLATKELAMFATLALTLLLLTLQLHPSLLPCPQRCHASDGHARPKGPE